LASNEIIESTKNWSLL